jgi:hypothetical protein
MNYNGFMRGIALKIVRGRTPDIPAFTLGIGVGETMESISHGRPVLTQPAQLSYGRVVSGGITPGQSYFGVSGFGDLVPMVDPGDIPYYGPQTGEV